MIAWEANLNTDVREIFIELRKICSPGLETAACRHLKIKGYEQQKLSVGRYKKWRKVARLLGFWF